MNPAILGALLRTIGRASAFNAADKIAGDSRESDRPSAREEAERMIAARQRERDAIFSQSRSVDPNEQREKSLRQKLSDVVFSQSEAKRGQIDRSQETQTAARPEVRQSNEQIGRRQIDEEEEGIETAKTFSDRLRDGATAVAGFLGPIGKGVVAVAGFVKGLELMNTGVLALNRDLAQFNGQLAAAYASYEVDEMQRKIKRGESLQGPLSNLAENQSELRDQTSRPINAASAIGTAGLAGLTKVITLMLKYDPMFQTMTWCLEYVAGYFGQNSGQGPDIPPWQTFFADVQDGKFDGKRPTFTGPKNLHSDKDMKDIFG